MAGSGLGKFVRNIPLVGRIIDSTRWKLYRHRVSMRKERRTNSHFTGFNRLPTQFAALTGPVFEHVCVPGKEIIRIVVVGCSNGAEAYTISKWLRLVHPDTPIEIIGCDIEESVVEIARTAVYDAAEEVHNNKKLPAGFVETLFTKEGDQYRVKPEFSKCVSFRTADVLNAEEMAQVGPADIVFAQNFLFHLSPGDADKAFDNLVSIMGPHSAIFVDGTDLPIRHAATLRHELRPLDYEVETIHNEAMWTRANGWPYQYWGLEPFGTITDDLERRYSTIFLRDEVGH